MDAPHTLLDERYRLVRVIAAGGMGVVWEGWDLLLERPVAVKQLRTQPGVSEEEADTAKNRAMREARIAARLHHPNAVPVFDAVEQDGQPCLVMQYVPSTPLSRMLRDQGPLPPREAARIGAQVASALAAAHRLGIVHRDVKPGNVLLDEEGRALISDFGISRALGDATLTSTGLVHGTPAYLAPEVARGDDSTFASDVFSLGSTLYAAVEGEPPFGADANSIAVLHRVAMGDFAPPRHAGALTSLLLEMLAAEPDRRPPMSRVAAELDLLRVSAESEPTTRLLAGRDTEPDETSAWDEHSGPTAVLPVVPLPAPAVDAGSEAVDAGSEAVDAGPEADDAGPEADDGAGPEAVDDAAPEPDRGHDRVAGPEQAEADRPAVIEPADDLAAAPAGPLLAGPEEPEEPEEPHPPALTAADAAPRWVIPAAPQTAIADPAPRPGPVPTAAPPRAAAWRRRGLTIVLVAVILAVLAGLITAGLLLAAPHPAPPPLPALSHAERHPTVAASRTPAPTPAPTSMSAAPSPTPSVPSPTPPPAPSQTPATTGVPAAATPTSGQLADAIRSYFALLPGNTDAAWNRLTPAFQQGHAQGRAYFDSFWGRYQSVTASGVQGTAPDQAAATLTYLAKDGPRTVEHDTFRLVRQDGVLKIDGQSTG